MAGFAIEDAIVKSIATRIPVGQIQILFGSSGALHFACFAMLNMDRLIAAAVLSRQMRIRMLFEIFGRLFYLLAISLTPLSTPEESLHTSAYDRIKALKGNTISSAAVELVAIETEEAAKIRRTTTPDNLRKKLASAKKKRGPSILRDAWLSPLTLNECSKPGAQASQSGVRASDKGFLSMKLSWCGISKSTSVAEAQQARQTASKSQLCNGIGNFFQGKTQLRSVSRARESKAEFVRFQIESHWRHVFGFDDSYGTCWVNTELKA